jgi:NADP-dependent 3-hydroxy acid dehydrogenase YdfG
VTRDLATSLVVITGASSGIGRAAGHAFARQGSRLVLAARSEEPLRAVAQGGAARGARGG